MTREQSRLRTRLRIAADALQEAHELALETADATTQQAFQALVAAQVAVDEALVLHGRVVPGSALLTHSFDSAEYARDAHASGDFSFVLGEGSDRDGQRFTALMRYGTVEIARAEHVTTGDPGDDATVFAGILGWTEVDTTPGE
jgi:hypothetical protein